MPDDTLFSLMLLCQIHIWGLPLEGNEAGVEVAEAVLQCDIMLYKHCVFTAVAAVIKPVMFTPRMPIYSNLSPSFFSFF